MNKERVAFIRDRLMVIAEDEKAREHFDIDSWVAQSAMTHAEPVTVANMAIQHDCGFAGCILGWAAHEKWFQPWGYEAQASEATMVINRIGEEPRHPWEPERPFGNILNVDPAITNRIIYGSYYEGQVDAIDEAIELLTFLLDKGESAFINRYIDASYEGPQD